MGTDQGNNFAGNNPTLGPGQQLVDLSFQGFRVGRVKAAGNRRPADTDSGHIIPSP
jgi:hypothetical protein